MRFASVQKLRIIYRIVLYYVLSSGWVSYCITLYWWNPCRDRVISLSGQPSAACPAGQATLPPVSMPCNSSSRAQAQPAIERHWHTDSRVVLRAVNEPSQRFTVSFWRFRSLKLFVRSLRTSILIFHLLTIFSWMFSSVSSWILWIAFNRRRS